MKTLPDDRPRGTCPDCGRTDVAFKVDGTLRTHRHPNEWLKTCADVASEWESKDDRFTAEPGDYQVVQ